jgi:hypothetical protein
MIIQLNHPIYTQEEFDKEFNKLLTLDLSKAMSAVSESAKSTGEKTPAGATCKDYDSKDGVRFEKVVCFDFRRRVDDNSLRGC